MGEIVFDDEIQLRWMKFASTADGWISFFARARLHLQVYLLK